MRKISIPIFALFLLFITLLFVKPTNSLVFSELDFEINFEQKYTATTLTDHPPIYINSNDDFETYNFTGDGTIARPYIIANLNISATGATNGIFISGTTVYFEIWNCTILTEYIGIRIDAVNTGAPKIINNVCISTSGDGGGIGVGMSSYVTIQQNEMANFIQGVHLNSAQHCTITGNRIPWCNYQGINIRNSHYNDITYNQINNAEEHGVAMVGSSSQNTIHHNYFVNNSKAETYNIDGERTGPINSQGYDEGYSNTWYDETNEYGNHWSDYDGSGSYAIDGPSNSVDLYPLYITYPDITAIPIIPIIAAMISTVLIKIRKKRTK